MKFDQPPAKEGNREENLSGLVKQMSEFNNDELSIWNNEEHFTEYDKEGFTKFLKKENINVQSVMDNYLNDLDPSDTFSEKEMTYIEAFKAWLHCNFDDAKKYLGGKFDFQCDTNENFIKKYQFFNVVAYFIFEYKYTNYRNKETESEEKFIFNTLKERAKKKVGSFLLNYLSEDYISVAKKERGSVEGDEVIDWIPFKIAPDIYAFDSRESMFTLVNKNDLADNTLYVSDKKDYKTITQILKGISNSLNNVNQELFDKLIIYFQPLDQKELSLEPQKGNMDKTESFLFRKLHSGYHRTKILEKTGVELSKIPLLEQRYFVNYLKFVDCKSVQNLQNFNKKYGNSGFRTFLSIEQGGKEMGDKILELGEKLPKETSVKIFAKFGEIIDSSDEVIDVIRSRFDKKIEVAEPVLSSIRQMLLKKGSDLLIEYSDMASKCGTEKECAEIGKDILARLEKSKHSALLLGSAFKSVLKGGISLEQIKDVTLESTSDKAELTKYRDEMKRIFTDNRTNYPKELLKETLDEFEYALEHPENKEFFILKDKEDIIAFMRFDKLPNGNLYAGSLNSLTEIHGLAIGGALLKKLLAEKSTASNIEAVVYDKNPMLGKYTSEYGFEIVGEIENYKNTGEKFYKIEIKKGSLAKKDKEN